MIEELALILRHQRAHRNADEHCKEQRKRAEFDRNGELRPKNFGDGNVVAVNARRAQIALEEKTLEEVQHLHRHRFIHAHDGQTILNLFLRHFFIVWKIAFDRHLAHQNKYDGQDDEQCDE